MGFNSGSGAYFALPGSFTRNAVRLTCGGANGCYTFRVDQASIIAGSATPSNSPTGSRSYSATSTPSQWATPSPMNHEQARGPLPLI